MKYLVASILAVLSYGSCAQAQEPAAAAAAANASKEIYFRSLTAPAVAGRCEAAIPGYGSEFGPAFEMWKVHNAAVIEAERELQRAKLKPGETLEQYEASVPKWMLIGMDAGLTPQTLRNMCGHTLEGIERLDGAGEAGA